jgi:hypothetical protein
VSIACDSCTSKTPGISGISWNNEEPERFILYAALASIIPNYPFLAQLKAEVVKWFEWFESVRPSIGPSTWCARFVTIRPSPYPIGSW